MAFVRKLLSKQVVELTDTVPIDLDVTFKQYDIESSILVIDTTYEGSPTVFESERVYATYSVHNNKYGERLPINDINNQPICDIGKYNETQQGRLEIKVSKEIIKYTGVVVMEIIIVDPHETSRFTSPQLSFKIEKSLIDNGVDIAPPTTDKKAICGQVKCGEVKCGEDVGSQEVARKTYLNKDFMKRRN